MCQPTSPAEYLGTVEICPRVLLANVLNLFNERGEVYAHQIGMSPFNFKKFCRTFVSGFVCLTRKADATMRKIRNREFVKQSLAKGGEFS